MQNKIRCLIVDDEPPARELLRYYLAEKSDVQIIDECGNGFDAVKSIVEHTPDLVFLDIQMPRLSGFEVLELLKDPPGAVIFCTAFDSYAIRAFELHAVDYLLKPFSQERFDQALERAREKLRGHGMSHREELTGLAASGQTATGPLERIVAKTGTSVTVIPVDAIHYLEAQEDYVMVVSDLGNHLKDRPLKFYESHLPDDLFIRIHRKYIVNVRHIRSISLYGKESYLVKLRSGTDIRASLAGYKRLKALL